MSKTRWKRQKKKKSTTDAPNKRDTPRRTKRWKVFNISSRFAFVLFFCLTSAKQDRTHILFYDINKNRYQFMWTFLRFFSRIFAPHSVSSSTHSTLAPTLNRCELSSDRKRKTASPVLFLGTRNTDAYWGSVFRLLRAELGDLIKCIFFVNTINIFVYRRPIYLNTFRRRALCVFVAASDRQVPFNW